MHHTIEIDETDYQYLASAAHMRGVTIKRVLKQLIAGQQLIERRQGQTTATRKQAAQAASRWSAMSERIRHHPPLRGAGEFVQQCAEEFRDDFAFPHDREDG